MKKIKVIVILIAFVCFIIIYLIYNIFNYQTLSVPFKLLNSMDVLCQLQLKQNLSSSRNTIFNLNIKYQLNSGLCDNTIKYLIIVTSYFGNIETRSAMRRAFSNDQLHNMNIKRVFLLGTINDQYITQQAVEDESNRFNDLLQGNFIEAYKNLTYKHMMGLKWATDYCTNVKYILKMDDDIVLDVRRIITFLNNGTLVESNLLAGYVLKHMTPKREKANKWYVSYDEYSEDNYPTFLSGWFYITNPQTAKLLLIASKMYKYFWIDDTLITGILARLLQIKHVSLAKFFTLHGEFIRCCIADLERYGYDCPFVIGPNGGDNNLFFEFNMVMNKCHKVVCNKRISDIDKTCVVAGKTQLGPSESAIIEKYNLF